MTQDAEFVRIPRKEYERLMKIEELLEALEQGGVNSWDWYGDSISDYIKNNDLAEDYFDAIR